MLSGASGPVFGNRDYFTGLGIFFDTYSNENGDHAVSADWYVLLLNGRTILSTSMSIHLSLQWSTMAVYTMITTEMGHTAKWQDVM